jgi:ankyrin repeat protein
VRLLDILGRLINCTNRWEICGPSTTLLHFLAFSDVSEAISLWYASEYYEKAESKYNQSALHWAAYYGSNDAAQTLIELGANVTPEPRIEDPDGTESEFIQHWIRNLHFPLDSRDDHDRTAIHLAASEGHLDTISLLISSYMSLPQRLLQTYDNNGGIVITPEMVSKHMLSLEKLLDLQDIHHNTALHLAVMSGQLSVAEVLLQNGANWRLTNGTAYMETPEEMAIRLGNSNSEELGAMATKLGKNSVDLKMTFKSIVRLFKTTAFAALDLIEVPIFPAVDRMFEATRVRISPHSRGPIQRTQFSVPELISGSHFGDDPNGSPAFNWIHLPANNVSFWTCHSQIFLAVN